ncbi:AraC family transcriptional regulator [uncultured Cohaesibacter sp.]|uniref:AraC family transcriptional regulator n=1 Tax=uncultured Cohaesibacter sp. TaxID=1002546 RepID=UPI0029C75868|nr:AraC family transcriptional regulator [uncultured Cohaesibacter sp.]
MPEDQAGRPDLLCRLQLMALSCLSGRTEPIVREEILAGVELFAATSTQPTMSELYAPMASIVIQGTMEVTIGQTVLHYDPGSCFIGSIDLPITSRITSASPEQPYLALNLMLEQDSLADLIAEAIDLEPEQGKCYALGPASLDLLDACARLLKLPASPEDLPVMGPLIRREILYRLLRGPQGGAIHQIVLSDPRIQQIRRALNWIRTNLDKSVPIEDMASCAGMSQPSFRRHFRTATGMSPLQYQKTLRLQAARRSILAGAEVSRAAFAVGYESPSQFSREYSRMFGVPPSRDASRDHRSPAQSQREAVADPASRAALCH